MDPAIRRRGEGGVAGARGRRLTIDLLCRSDAVQRSRVIAFRRRALVLSMGDVMPRIRKLIAMAFALIPVVLVFTASAARAEKRLALVVGNSGYQVGAL